MMILCTDKLSSSITDNHDLSLKRGLQVGDPLEKAALRGIDWIYTSDEKAIPKK